MTTTQSFKIYEVLQKHFKNDADAKTVVAEIESIVENKFETEKKQIATKEDILNLRVDMEKRFNAQIIWTVSTGIAVMSILLVILKLK